VGDLYQDFDAEASLRGDMERSLIFFTSQGAVRQKVELEARSM